METNIDAEKGGYKVLARKYRPQKFDDVCSQEHIIQIFKNAIETNRIGHAYLFTGSRGVGKTSIARILAKSLNCTNSETVTYFPCGVCANCVGITESQSPDVAEIDGASNTGVDDIRELQKELLYFRHQSRYKIIIIDEVHMLSKNAFNALLKTLEEPPENVIFIFATTEPHKVLPTIISRCQRFDFRKIPVDLMVKQLHSIAKKENISVDDEALHIIAKKADGGMRDALSIMDQVISYGLEHITAKDVQQIFGLIDFEVFNDFMRAISNKNPAEMLTLYAQLSDNGMDIQEFINSFLEYLRTLMFIKLKIKPAELSQHLSNIMTEIANYFSEDEIIYIINYLIETKNNLRTSSSPEILAELTFVKIAKIAEMKSLKEILDTMNTPQTGHHNTQRPPMPPPQYTPPPPPPPTQQTPPPPQQTPPPPATQSFTLTEQILREHWISILEELKEKHPIYPTILEKSNPEKIENNTIFFTCTHEETYNRLKAEKNIYDEILSKHFSHPVYIEFRYTPQRNVITNPTLQDIKEHAPELAQFIAITDATQNKG